MVYHVCDKTWRPRRQTKDKVDKDKEKCGGTLIVCYTPSDKFEVKAGIVHCCNGQS